MCLDCACGAADRPAPPLAPSPAAPSSSPAKTPAAPLTVNLGLKLLARNDQEAATNRARFRAAGVRAVNLLSSPGSGKTALLEALARTAQGGGGSACTGSGPGGVGGRPGHRPRCPAPKDRRPAGGADHHR